MIARTEFDLTTTDAPPTPQDAKPLLLENAYDILAKLAAVPTLAGFELRVQVVPLYGETKAAVCARGGLTPSQQAVVDLLLPDKPTKGQVIAMRLGKNFGGSFRNLLANLERFGYARHIKGQGYLLPA